MVDTKRTWIAASLVLTMLLSFAGAVLAETPQAAGPQPVDLGQLLAPAPESCDTPAEAPENTVTGLENELLAPAAGEPCGQKTCGAKQFCCNFSCSICAPIGGACIQIVC
jgi:hypothetical protein